MSRFDGKTVLITGAAKGQGRNHAVTFATLGANVAICDIGRQVAGASLMGTPQQLVETARLVEEQGVRCVSMIADTRSSEQMRDFVASARDEFGSVDIFIANAGIAAYGPFVEMSDEVWHDVVSINLTGVARSIRAVVPAMIEQESGRIIATSSQVAREGGPNNTNYAASKWGVLGFVKSLAIELAPHGITVNALSPMSVATDMCHNVETYRLFRPDLENPTENDVRGAFGTLNPMGVPWLDCADVTAAAVYLASDHARYVTGVALDIAAGWNAKHSA